MLLLGLRPAALDHRDLGAGLRRGPGRGPIGKSPTKPKGGRTRAPHSIATMAAWSSSICVRSTGNPPAAGGSRASHPESFAQLAGGRRSRTGGAAPAPTRAGWTLPGTGQPGRSPGAAAGSSRTRPGVSRGPPRASSCRHPSPRATGTSRSASSPRCTWTCEAGQLLPAPRTAVEDEQRALDVGTDDCGPLKAAEEGDHTLHVGAGLGAAAPVLNRLGLPLRHPDGPPRDRPTRTS